MENNNILKQELPHIAIAKDIASKLTTEYGSEEQAQFINEVKKAIEYDYQCKLQESEAHFKSLQDSYDIFKENCKHDI